MPDVDSSLLTALLNELTAAACTVGTGVSMKEAAQRVREIKREIRELFERASQK